MKVAIVTDSNSGITQEEGKKAGIFVLPMPFMISEDTYFEDINLSQDEFYEKLKHGANISTSQPIIASLLELWDSILKDYDQIVHIPMSSGLSESCNTATTFSKDFNGKVQVVDNQRISITQKTTVYHALAMSHEGKTAEQIKETLENIKYDSSIYIMVDTLKYLKKGGRVTPAGAAIGTLLNIKPVLQIQGGKLDAFQKVISVKNAKSAMIKAIIKDLSTRFSELKEQGKMYLSVAYTHNKKIAEEFVEEIKSAIPNIDLEYIDPLSLSVSCHIGPGALAIACYRKDF